MKKITIILSLLLTGISSSAFSITTPLILKGDPAGNQWESESSITDAKLTAISQKDHVLMALGQSNSNEPLTFKSEDDGKNWTINHALNGTFYALTSSKNWLVAGSGPVILSSEDGENWTDTPIPTEVKTNNAKMNLIAANGKQVIAAGNYTQPPYNSRNIAALLISEDEGNHWQSITSNLPAEFSQEAYFSSLTYAEDKWFLAGHFGAGGSQKGFMLISNNGINWRLATIPANNIDISSIAYNEKVFLAAGIDYTGTYIMKSMDHGNTWTKDVYPLKGILASISKIHSNGKIWAAVGSAYENNTDPASQHPFIMTSVDGDTWIEEPLPQSVITHTGRNIPTQTLKDILWTGSNWIAVGVYDKPNSPCESFYGHWTGSLTDTATGKTISVTQLSLVGIGKSSDEFHYNIGGGAIEYWADSANISVGIGGTCVEENNIATIEVENGRSGNYTRLSATKSNTSKEILVTSSNLSDGKIYRNYTGKLFLGN